MEERSAARWREYVLSAEALLGKEQEEMRLQSLGKVQRNINFTGE